MRLHAIDFLRGLALTIVLVDHVDMFAREDGFIRNWTLMGLGFSDAAEVFVFLSGFTFGWVYNSRLTRDGFVACQWHVLIRATRIYVAYLITVAFIWLLGFQLRSTSAPIDPALGTHTTSRPGDALLESLCMMHQPFAVEILCMYVVLVPLLPALLAICRYRWWAAVALSGCVYAAVQFNPGINLPTNRIGDWFFNPFAWQLLLILGMVCGQRRRDAQWTAPQVGIWTLLSVLLLLYGLYVRKVVPLLSNHPAEPGFWIDIDFWTSKPQLAPLRLLHFLAVAYLVMLILPRNGAVWRHPLVTPFTVCGRHSLSVYCVGIGLAYLAMVAFHFAGTAPLTVLLIAVDACVLQFVFARMLDRRVAITVTSS